MSQFSRSDGLSFPKLLRYHRSVASSISLIRFSSKLLSSVNLRLLLYILSVSNLEGWKSLESTSDSSGILIWLLVYFCADIYGSSGIIFSCFLHDVRLTCYRSFRLQSCIRDWPACFPHLREETWYYEEYCCNWALIISEVYFSHFPASVSFNAAEY